MLKNYTTPIIVILALFVVALGIGFGIQTYNQNQWKTAAISWNNQYYKNYVDQKNLFTSFAQSGIYQMNVIPATTTQATTTIMTFVTACPARAIQNDLMPKSTTSYAISCGK